MADVADDRVELLADWTVRDDDLGFVSQAHERTRLGLLVLLKFFELHARFPTGEAEVPAGAVEIVATQAGLNADSLGEYSWEGRTVERHRA